MKQAEWKALIADDEPAARRGVRYLLAAFPEFAIVGECRNGIEVLAALEMGSSRRATFLVNVESDEGARFGLIERLGPGQWRPTWWSAFTDCQDS